MAPPTLIRRTVTTGVNQLDSLLDGLYIGDNVVWHDDAGSLASVFCMILIKVSQAQHKPIIYVSFDRSPRNLLEKMGNLADYRNLTILDCFTLGKGAGSDVFLRFYREPANEWPCKIVRVEEPRNMDRVMDALYGIHCAMTDDVRLIFESITGMQELWGGEEEIRRFYTHSCPRLYELQTIAYWILEKDAHSPQVRAHINQIAQVAIDLSVRRGTTTLTLLKAEDRAVDNLHRPFRYWTKDLDVTFEDEKKTSGRIELGPRIKEIRSRRGLSQTELARLVGVTPSTISQVESNLIYPSLPALLKIAEVMSVEVSSFFVARSDMNRRLLFTSAQAVDVKLEDFPEDILSARMLTPLDFESKAEPFLIEIPPETKLPSHFFIHKGEEMGYLVSGTLQMTVNRAVHKLRSGDVVYLTSDIPNGWFNPGPETARLLWIKVN